MTSKKKKVRVNDTEVQLLHMQDKISKLEQQVADLTHRVALMQSNGQFCYKKVDTMSMQFASFFEEHLQKLKTMENQYNKTLHLVQSMQHKLYDPQDDMNMFDIFFQDNDLEKVIETELLDKTNCKNKA